MIRPPSSQRQWDAFTSIDPAFAQRPALPAEPTDADRSALADYDAKITAAKETGDWRALLVEGQSPTKFVMGQIDRNTWRAIMDRAVLPGDSPRHIGQIALHALLVRLALRSVVGFGDVKIERQADPQWEYWPMAQAEIVTQLDEIDPRIVGELGSDVFKRLQGASPRS